MIICFSGTDGSGKTTQINEAIKILKSNNYKTKYIWSRGGYTPLFNLTKKLLWLIGKNNINNNILSDKYIKRRKKILNNVFIAKVWLFISTIDLILLYCLYVRLLSLFGYIVICDRYVADTSIDFSINFSNYFNEKGLLYKVLTLLAPNPDLHIVITVPVNISLSRGKKKNEPFPDDFEKLKIRLKYYNKRKEFFGKNKLRLNGCETITFNNKLIIKKIFNLIK